MEDDERPEGGFCRKGWMDVWNEGQVGEGLKRGKDMEGRRKWKQFRIGRRAV